MTYDYFACQVLDVWRKQRVNTCTMLVFLRELTQHEWEGFINPSVWQDLRLHVHPDLLREENVQQAEATVWTRSKFQVAFTKFVLLPSSHAGS